MGQLVTHRVPISKDPAGHVKQFIPELTSWQVAQVEGQIMQFPEI